MSAAFQIPAQFTGCAFTADKCMSLRFHTQEMNDNKERFALADLLHSQGYLLFRPNAYKDEEVPQEDAPEFGKTHSQRLHNVLFRVWEKLHKENRAGDNFETWRISEMEKIISHYKQKLD